MQDYERKVERVLVALEVIGGKWKPLILWHVLSKPKRYSELRRLIPDITEKVLIEQLRDLEREGVISRTVHSEKPPVVEYSATEHGRTLQTVFQTLSHWGRDHLQYLAEIDISAAP